MMGEWVIRTGLGVAAALAVLLGVAPAAGALAAPLYWQPVKFPAGKDLWGVGYGGNQFIAGGAAGTILTSGDGRAWSKRASGTERWLAGVACANGRCVIVGEEGVILTSDNGTTWTPRPSGTTDWLKGVVHAGGQFVAVGRHGTLLTSRDGTAWTLRKTDTTNWLQSVAHDGKRFVAVGEQGTVLTSDNGASWTVRKVPTADWLSSVAYGNGRFVAVGERGLVLTSRDGVNWERQTSGTDRFLQGVTYGDGRFVAVGEHGEILLSEDGTAWTPQVTPTGNRFKAVAFGGGRFVAVGEGGAIATAGPELAGVTVTERSWAEVDGWLKGVALPEGVSVIGKGWVYAAAGEEGSGSAAGHDAPFTMAVHLTHEDLPAGVHPSRVGVFRIEAGGVPVFVGGRWRDDRLIVTLPGFGRYVLADVHVAFNDMEGHWAQGDVELMAAKQVARGMAGGAFRPDEPVTRAQFAAMLVRAMGLPPGGTLPAFRDVRPTDWYFGDLGTALNAGIISGYADGAFRPDAPVTREEVAVMVARALKASGSEGLPGDVAARVLAAYRDAGEVSPWARADLALAVSERIVQGKAPAAIMPKAGATRAEALAMIARYWRKAE